MQFVTWYCACPEQSAGLLCTTIKIHSGVANFAVYLIHGLLYSSHMLRHRFLPAVASRDYRL